MELASYSLSFIVAAFVVAAAAIAILGTKLARRADALADLTGLGEAMFGGVFLGASTSLPGIVASVSAAASGHAELAFSNALGGIAAQTVFLALADVAYRPANLEHAAASLENMLQGALLIALLMLVVLFMTGPVVTFFGVHPGSLGLLVCYVLGLRVVGAARRARGWRAARTAETVEDRPAGWGAPTRRGIVWLWVSFAVLAATMAVTGYAVARLGIAIAGRTGLSETVVGGFFTAVATSLPELVTALAAVRQGALTLAVGNIIGGNSFDVLFLTFADVAYRGGSLYHAVGAREIYIISLAAGMTAVLLMGLLRREKHGIGNVGFESLVILVAYAAGVTLLFFR